MRDGDVNTLVILASEDVEKLSVDMGRLGKICYDNDGNPVGGRSDTCGLCFSDKGVRKKIINSMRKEAKKLDADVVIYQEKERQLSQGVFDYNYSFYKYKD